MIVDWYFDFVSPLKERVDAFERALVEALRETSGDRAEAARRLGIGRATHSRDPGSGAR